MYIPWEESPFFTEDEKAKHRRRYFSHRTCSPLSDQEIKEEQEWSDRFIALTAVQDMRQFFRAGFQKVHAPLLVLDDSDAYLYILPSAAGIKRKPIRSVEEVLKVLDVAKPSPKPKRSAEERKFQELIKERAWQRKFYANPLWDPVKQQMYEVVMQQRNLQEGILKDGRDLSYYRPSRLENTWISPTRSNGNSTSELQNQKKLLQEFDADVAKKDVTKFLSSEASNPNEVIIQFEAIHTCAFHSADAYIELLLLGFLPDDSMKKKAINFPNADDDGLTPLMVAASSGCRGSRIWGPWKTSSNVRYIVGARCQ
jgi:hypothetical protein